MDRALQLNLKQVQELKTDMTTAKDKMQSNIRTSHGEMINSTQDKISDIQDKITSDISAIRFHQAELEERITDKPDKQLKGAVTVVEEQTQLLSEEFNSEIQETRRAWNQLDTTARELATRMEAVESQTTRRVGGNAGAITNTVKP
jgi:hypothetical protein